MKNILGYYLFLIMMCILQNNYCLAQKLEKMPQLHTDQVWISSVPTGLNIYFAKDTTTGNLDEESSKVYNRKENRFFLMQNKYLKGKTPILLNSVSPGKYLIGIEPVDLIIIKKSRDPNAFFDDISFHNSDPTHKASAVITPIPLGGSSSLLKPFQQGKFKNTAVAYSFSKSDSAGSCFIILTSTDSTITDVKTKALYPKGNNYEFDDTKLKNSLMNNGYIALHLESQIPEIINYLHRGGKVIAGDKNTEFVVELVRPYKWVIDMRIKVVN
ncbi:MAG: hypothetical protein NTZ27_04060 [Ignavibacteriales bacterium]|nr:hypothetical protein [Ignavibacteriales bacterium]